MKYVLVIKHGSKPVEFTAATYATISSQVRVWLVENRDSIDSDGVTVNGRDEQVTLLNRNGEWRIVWSDITVRTTWRKGKSLFAEECGRHIRYGKGE